MSDFWSSRFEEGQDEELDLATRSSQMLSQVLSQPSMPSLPAEPAQYESFRKTFFEDPASNPAIQNAHVTVGLNMRVDDERWVRGARGQHFSQAPRHKGDIFSASAKPVDAMYDVDVGIARSSRDSLWGISVRSSAPRFPERRAATPGPGQYVPRDPWKPKPVCGFVPQSAAYASTTDRFADRVDPHLRRHRRKPYRDVLEVGRKGAASMSRRRRQRAPRTAKVAVDQSHEAVAAPAFSFTRQPRPFTSAAGAGAGWAKERLAQRKRPQTEVHILRIGHFRSAPAEEPVLAPVVAIGRPPRTAPSGSSAMQRSQSQPLQRVTKTSEAQRRGNVGRVLV